MAESIVSSSAREELNQLKGLRKGTTLVFGSAFQIPILAKLEMPDPSPLSSNVMITQKWFEEPKEKSGNIIES